MADPLSRASAQSEATSSRVGHPEATVPSVPATACDLGAHHSSPGDPTQDYQARDLLAAHAGALEAAGFRVRGTWT